MKKLMFGVSAVLAMYGANATEIWNKTNYDLVGHDYTTATSWGVGSCNAPESPATYYLSADLTAPINTFLSTSYQGNGSVSEFDFKGYTLKTTLSAFSFYFNSGTISPSTITMKDGVLDGSASSSSTPSVYVQSDGDLMASTTFDNFKVNNFNEAHVCDGMRDSTVTLKNGSKFNLAGSFICFATTKVNDNNDSVIIESGSKVTCKTFDVDGWNTSKDEGAPSLWNKKVIVTGEGSAVTVGGTGSNYGSFGFGNSVKGLQLIVDDHASFYANTWPTVGASVPYCSLTVANGATWTSHSIYLGGSSQPNNTMVVKDGGKVSLGGDYICVGRGSDNNTLILSNADVSAMGAIVVGGEWKDPAKTDPSSVKATAGNAVYICGETKLPSTNGTALGNQWPVFYNNSGLICFSGYTNTTGWAGETLTLPSGTQVQSRDYNEVRFDNGADVAINWITIAEGHTGSKITVKDSTLFVKSKFDDYGTGTVLELDNGQFTMEGTNPWNFYFNQSTTATQAATCVFKGDHPQLWNKTPYHSEYGASQVHFWTKTSNYMTIRIYLPEGAQYQKPLVRSGYVNFNGVGTIDIPNLAEVRKTLAEPVDVPLAYAENSLVSPPTSVSLPAGCSLVSGTDGTAKTLSIRIQPIGLSYDEAFTTIDDYNEAVTNAETASIYANKDTYLVVRGLTLDVGSTHDYSLAKQKESATNPKLHVFFYNCTFPAATNVVDGTMSPDNGDVVTELTSNRKMIALCTAKEVWIEGCEFNYYHGDSYVIDLNLYNKFDNDGCGITIKNNNFKTHAGKRVPISVKNKSSIPPAFVLIEGNTFAACDHDISDTTDVVEDSTYAGVICFGDQSGSTTTAGGANFPVTIKNNTFAEGVTQYVVMSGMYVSSGKQGIDIATDKPYTWFNLGDTWTGNPAFAADTAKDLGNGVKASLKDDGTCVINAGSASAVTAAMISSLGKDNLKSLTLDANITSVDASAFAKCYGLSSVTFKASAVSVGANAFLRCNSLENIIFTGTPDLGENAITLQAAIYMKEGVPTITTIPTVTVNGYKRNVYGTNELKGNDTDWELVDNTTKYHFFKVVLEKNK